MPRIVLVRISEFLFYYGRVSVDLWKQNAGAQSSCMHRRKGTKISVVLNKTKYKKKNRNVVYVDMHLLGIVLPRHQEDGKNVNPAVSGILKKISATGISVVICQPDMHTTQIKKKYIL